MNLDIKEESNEGSILSGIVENIKLFIIVLIATTLINTLLITFSTVKQSSMEKTLYEDEVIVIEKLTFLFTEPKFGNIVIFVEDEAIAANYLTKIRVLYEDIKQKFTKKEQRIRLVKRVIGVPGDEIDIKDGYVYKNGEKLKESYIEDLTFERDTFKYPVVVPEEEYFVLGDNRDVSKDSRQIGFIPRENIEGRAVFRVFPFRRFGVLK